MSVTKQLIAITATSAVLLLALLASAHRAASALVTTAPHLWGATQLSACIVLLVTLGGALGALWHLCSALLALLALPRAVTAQAGLGRLTEADAATRLLRRWGAPLVRRALIGALLAGTVTSPALAAETTPTDDLGWQPTSSAADSTEPALPVAPGPVGSATPVPATTGAATSEALPQGPAPAATAVTETRGPSKAPEPHRPASPSPGGGATTHVVAVGESLWSVTADLLGADATPAEVAQTWPELYAANAGSVGSDPSLLMPDTELLVPASLSRAGADPSRPSPG